MLMFSCCEARSPVLLRLRMLESSLLPLGCSEFWCVPTTLSPFELYLLVTELLTPLFSLLLFAPVISGSLSTRFNSGRIQGSFCAESARYPTASRLTARMYFAFLRALSSAAMDRVGWPWPEIIFKWKGSFPMAEFGYFSLSLAMIF